MSTEEVQGPIAVDEEAEASAPAGFSTRLSTQAGRYTVRVLDEAGRSDVRDVSVEIVP